MGKDLDLHKPARWPGDVLITYALDDSPYLVETKFSSQYDHVGEG